MVWRGRLRFFRAYGVAPERLIAAARLARGQGVSPDRALLANGGVEERFFYRCLARHLGLVFIDRPVRLLAAAKNYPQAIHAGLIPFEGPAGLTWLVAPRGNTLVVLLEQARRGEGLRSRLAITTPSQLSLWVRHAARRKIAADASLALLSADAGLSAHGGSNPFQRSFVWVGALLLGLCFMIAPRQATNFYGLVTGFLFLAGLLFRLLVSAAAMGAPRQRREPLEDHQLPVYTIVIALYKEARIVRQLVARLDRIDYPRAKLDIKLVLEEDDDETRRAIAALALAPIYEIIIVPPGDPRTKPRALNVALPLARGELLAVFDAEDEPDPQQIRLAAELFAGASARLACLQARLAIDNVRDRWLTRLFAIEYASLFNLQNIGLADLGLPIPVSGSSNHFRTGVLREIGGWDAWNVTEDADIGLRLTRFGYFVGVLESTTHEEAPVSLAGWFGQRRRWFKGWLQTLVTISRSPFSLVAEVGPMRSVVIILLFFGLLLGPLFWIPASAIVVASFAVQGSWTPTDFYSLCLDTLWASVSLVGIISLFWHALIGMKRQRLLSLWPVLPLLLPYYCLHSIAAWMAVYDLFARPFHWHKTEHGLARTSLRRRFERSRDGLPPGRFSATWSAARFWRLRPSGLWNSKERVYPLSHE